ncbi:MAG: A24 family peptidase [Spirochaetaceae bacterium]|nr:A24 family peptidase [Spirochaetaceae bacterium]
MLFIILVFAAFAIPITVIDIKTYRIPNILNYLCAIGLLVLRIIQEQNIPWVYMACGIGASLFLFAVSKIKGGMGLGDVKYAFSVGLLCGFPGTVLALLVSSIIGIVWSLIKKQQRMPFAPCLAIGALLACLLGCVLSG